jgi:hypothetical protein
MRSEMHDAAVVAYPRPAGVVVPEILLRAGCPVPEDPRSPDGRAQAVAATISWLRARAGRLPDFVRQAELPDPGIMLRCWQLGARTRGALARLPSIRGRSWRLADLLGRERVGPAVLADLLAAREEQARQPAAPPPPRAGRLDALTAAIRARLPCLERELRQLCDDDSASAAQVGRLYREWNADVPFRALRRDGETILVAPSAVDTAESLMMAASHLIFRHGLAALQDVTARVRTTSNVSGPVDEELVRRILPLVPSFRWLDEGSGWFSFAGAGGQVPALVGKMFAVSRRVSYDDVCLAIGKQVRPFRTAPRAAVQQYLTVLGCRTLNDWVLPGPGLPPGRLTRSDRAILAVLASAGDAAPVDQLRQAAGAARITPATLRRFLRTSPIVVTDGRKVRITGTAATRSSRLAQLETVVQRADG